MLIYYSVVKWSHATDWVLFIQVQVQSVKVLQDTNLIVSRIGDSPSSLNLVKSTLPNYGLGPGDASPSGLKVIEHA